MATVRLIVLLGGILLFWGIHTDTQTSPEDAIHLFGQPQFIHAFIIIAIRIDVEKRTLFIQPHS